MKFKEIDVTGLSLNPFNKIGKEWFLVSAGNKESFNTMTASWGFMGVMWNKNCVITAIRPQRYTKEFVDSNEYFTISFFDETHKDSLKFCGSHSGRDVDKMKETGLNPIDLKNSVGFLEAELILVCKKLYNQEMNVDSFIEKDLANANYPSNDYHTVYVGEIVKAFSK
ncbi:MAG: flavin reductase family protein [Clostridiales bacterium]|nr:flavin reductase family protein [Clostridiales bacterium]